MQLQESLLPVNRGEVSRNGCGVGGCERCCSTISLSDRSVVGSECSLSTAAVQNFIGGELSGSRPSEPADSRLIRGKSQAHMRCLQPQFD